MADEVRRCSHQVSGRWRERDVQGVPQPQGCFPALCPSRQKVRVQVPPYGCPCHEEPATLVLCSGEASLLHDVHKGWSDTWCSCYFCFLKGARTCFWIPGSGEPPKKDPPAPNDNLSISLMASLPLAVPVQHTRASPTQSEVMKEELRGHRDPPGSNSLASASQSLVEFPPVGLAETPNTQTQRSVPRQILFSDSNSWSIQTPK